MATFPFRQNFRKPSRQQSIDPHNDLHVKLDHYIGIDIGTGSARACIIDSSGDIKAREFLKTWTPSVNRLTAIQSQLRTLDFGNQRPDTTSNPPPTFGGVSVSAYSALSTNTISTPKLSEELVLMLHAPCQYSTKTQTSQSQ